MSKIIERAIAIVREIETCVMCNESDALPGMGCCKGCFTIHNDQRFEHIDATYIKTQEQEPAQ